MKIPKIKVSSVANLTDARYFAARGVDWLGFDFHHGTATALSPATALAIKEWVEGAGFIGAFDWADADEILQVVQRVGLQGVEVGKFTPAPILETLSSQLPVFREIVVEYDSSVADYFESIESVEPFVYATVLNFNKNGLEWDTLQRQGRFSIQALQELCERFPILIAMQISPETLPTFIEAVQPFGLVIEGGVEEKVGVKTFDDYDNWFDALEVVTNP